MSSSQTRWDETSPTLKHEVNSSPEQQNMPASEHAAVVQAQVGDHESTATPKLEDGVRTQDEADNSDDDFDPGEDFRDRVNAVKDGAEKRYNPMSETLPKLPAYHPSFIKAEKYCSDLMKEAGLILENAEYKDTRILQLLRKSSTGQKPEYPKPRIVGLMGDSGVGKSSLINSLLDVPDIALSGANGEACTNVITEYHQALPSQQTPFMSEITLERPITVRRILQSHLDRYHSSLCLSNETMDQEAIDELNAHVSTAIEIFQELFADREEFSNEERTREYLERAQSASDTKMLDQLCEWIQESISNYGAEGGILRRSAYAPEELANEIERFVKSCKHVLDEDDCHVPSLWPLVRTVRVFLDSALLKRGLIIADLPGLSDSNKTRTIATTRYMRRCHFGLLVAPIARIQTDNLVQRRLGEIHRLFGHRKGLLCSKIDDVNAKQKPSDLDATPEATEEHERLSEAHDRICNEKSLLTSMKKQARGKEKKTFSQKIGALELNKRIYSALLREGLIQMRNQKVTMIMRQKYKTLTQDNTPLVVFTVSNSDYIKHMEGYELSNEIPISVQATGIPDVRYRLSQLPARSRLDTLKQYCHGTVEDMVGSLRNWAHQSTIERRVELQELVMKPRTAVGAEISKYVTEMKSVLESCILQACEDRQEAWTGNSVLLFEKWSKEWHSSTFAAWCRNDGAHKTKARSYMSWNAELLGPVTKDLTRAWQLFDDGVAIANENCFMALVAFVDGIGEDLAAVEGISSEPMGPFLSSFASKKALLRKCLDQFSAKVREISRDTKLNIMMDDEDPDSYLLKAMSPLYHKCAKVTGKNLHTQRCTLLNDAMSKGVPFAGFCPGIKSSIEQEIDRRQQELLSGVQAVFNMVLEDFNSAFTVEEVPNPKRDLLRSQVQRFVEYAEARINGPLANELATAMMDSE
ncbi:hypothetical protein BDR22DRAFT_969026 [Usnea florida]